MKRVKILIIVFLVTTIIFPYVCVEINTLLYKSEFKELYLQTQEISSNNYCKVFSKTKNSSKVFYATETSTFMCCFIKGNPNDSWVLYSCDILWTKSGSASNFSYPFYPVKNFKSYFNQGTVSVKTSPLTPEK